MTLSIRLLLLSMLFLVSTAYSSVPPNPKILKKIKEGAIRNPYPMEHHKELYKRGVNAPWRAELVKKGIRVPPNMLTAKNKSKDVSIMSAQFKALLIVVDFSDHTSTVNPNFFDGLVFGTASNTLRDYYQVISYGQFDVVTVNLPSSMGWMRMGETYSYYVDGNHGFNDYPRNVQKLAEDAVHSVDAVVDFSNYDNDGDGYVDALMIVHSGPGAEFTGSPDDIWSHSWAMNSPQILDGVCAYGYTMMPEYWLTAGDMTVGVYAHEFAHMVFELPDLYDYDYNSMGLALWSLMAAGSWCGPEYMGETPSMPDAWSRMKMGFANVINVTTNITRQEIASAETSPTIYRLWHDGEISNEYFLVENRQQVGYDTYIPGNGLLIYHIDDTVSTGNDREWWPGRPYSSGHYLVALEQADTHNQLEKSDPVIYPNYGDQGDPYPGWSNNKFFSYWEKIYFWATNMPTSRSYLGDDSYVGVLNISDSAPTMTADLKVTGCEISLLPAMYNESGSGATYKLNGADVGPSWNGPLTCGQNITVEAVTNNPDHIFSLWDGSNNYSNPRELTSASYIQLASVIKQRLTSTLASPTASNGQPRLLCNADGTEYHLVYESCGEIWYTGYSNGVWSPERRISDGSGRNSAPCITNEGGKLFFAWQKYYKKNEKAPWYVAGYGIMICEKDGDNWYCCETNYTDSDGPLAKPPEPIICIQYYYEYGGNILRILCQNQDATSLKILRCWPRFPYDYQEVDMAYSYSPISATSFNQAIGFIAEAPERQVIVIDASSGVVPASDNIPLAAEGHSYGAFNGTLSLKCPQVMRHNGKTLCAWIEVQSYANRNVAFVCYQEKNLNRTWNPARVFDLYASAGNENPDDVQSLTMSRMVSESILMWNIGTNIYQARILPSDQQIENTGMTGYNPQLSICLSSSGASAINSIYCTNNTIPTHMTLGSVIHPHELTTLISLGKGWNLVSVPREVSNLNGDAVFPGKFGTMFSFNTATQNYNPEENLIYGQGYWTFYGNPSTISVTGPELGTIQIEVAHTGWALIGSRTSSIDLSSLQLSNGGLISGNTGYWYDPVGTTYSTVTQLTPGQGYWVYVFGATSWPCTITIPAP